MAATAARWSEGEIAFLHAHAERGAEHIAKALGRSVHSVEHQASRMRVSLRRRWLCPMCGRKSLMPLSPNTGWCRACTAANSADDAAAKAREAVLELRAEEARVMAARKRRQAHYSEASKARKKMCGFCDKREVKGK